MYSKLCFEQPLVWPATLSCTASFSGTNHFSYIMPLVWPATLSYLVNSQHLKSKNSFGQPVSFQMLLLCVFSHPFSLAINHSDEYHTPTFSCHCKHVVYTSHTCKPASFIAQILLCKFLSKCLRESYLQKLHPEKF